MRGCIFTLRSRALSTTSVDGAGAAEIIPNLSTPPHAPELPASSHGLSNEVPDAEPSHSGQSSNASESEPEPPSDTESENDAESQVSQASETLDPILYKMQRQVREATEYIQQTK